MNSYDRRKILGRLILFHAQEDLPQWIVDGINADRLDLSKKNFEDDDDLAERGKQWLAARDAENTKKGETARRERICMMADIPQKYRPFVMDPTLISDSESVLAVEQFIESKNKQTFLLLMGLKGRGKSLAAVYGISHWPDEYPRARYILAQDLAALGNFTEEDKQYLDDLHRAPCVALDEMGYEPLDAQGWARSRITSFIEVRSGAKSKLIMTTNLTNQQFADRYGSSMLDKIRGDGTVLDVSADRNRRAGALK